MRLVGFAARINFQNPDLRWTSFSSSGKIAITPDSNVTEAADSSFKMVLVFVKVFRNYFDSEIRTNISFCCAETAS